MFFATALASSLLTTTSIPANAADMSAPHLQVDTDAIMATMSDDHVTLSDVRSAPYLQVNLAALDQSPAAESITVLPPTQEQPTEQALEPDVAVLTQDPSSEATPVDAEESTEVVVTGRVYKAPKEDPLEKTNLAIYDVTQSVDKAVIAPVAKGYERIMPKPIRSGLRNFLRNLGEPVVALNFLLQLKLGKAAETVGRFAINSTFGVGGILDVAKTKPFNLPRRENGLANTLGFYGVGPGPYLFLPGIGATTVRDLFGRIVDLSIVPSFVGRPITSPAFSVPSVTLNSLNERIRNDEQITELRDRSDDAYGSTREAYLAYRQAEIDALKGKKPKAQDAVPLAPISDASASSDADVAPSDSLEGTTANTPAETAPPEIIYEFGPVVQPLL